MAKKYYCPNCGETVLKKDKFCIKCGYHFDKKEKKVAQTILLIFSLLFSSASLALSIYLCFELLNFHADFEYQSKYNTVYTDSSFKLGLDNNWEEIEYDQATIAFNYNKVDDEQRESCLFVVEVNKNHYSSDFEELCQSLDNYYADNDLKVLNTSLSSVDNNNSKIYFFNKREKWTILTQRDEYFLSGDNLYKLSFIYTDDLENEILSEIEQILNSFVTL